MNSDNYTKTNSVDEIRKKHPRAYEKWSEQEDELLLNLIQQGESTKKLCTIFQRGKGAIHSRIRKLERPEPIDYSGFLRANYLRSDISYDWIPVFQDEDEIYYFPNSLTSYMKRLYPAPSIYRWNVYKETPTDIKMIYIGEGQKLIPDRINGYLNPGPSQMTNKRLNTHFRDQIENGHKVLLEIIRFDEMRVGEFVFNQVDLRNKHCRRFLEQMLITYYQQKGYSLLNR